MNFNDHIKLPKNLYGPPKTLNRDPAKPYLIQDLPGPCMCYNRLGDWW